MSLTDDILMHYGMPRRSGRYPWGSGDNPYQHSGDFLSRVEELFEARTPKYLAEIAPFDAHIRSIDSEGSEVTIVAFLIFPTATNNFNIESLRGQSIAKMLRETVQNIQSEIGKRIYEMCLQFV